MVYNNWESDFPVTFRLIAAHRNYTNAELIDMCLVGLQNENSLCYSTGDGDGLEERVNDGFHFEFYSSKPLSFFALWPPLLQPGTDIVFTHAVSGQQAAFYLIHP